MSAARKKVTISHVAERAGVSVPTVSRVLNHPHAVRPDTRQRVQEAIRELGYVPQATARNLRSGQPTLVCLLVSGIHNPFWSAVAASVEAFFADKAVGVLLSNTRSRQEERLCLLDRAMAQGASGVVFTPLGDDEAFVQRASQHGLACVAIDRPPGLGVDTVRGDSIGGALALTDLLIQAGHRRIALVNGPPYHPSAHDRYAGYVQALKQAGIPVDQGWVRWGAYKPQAAVQATREILSLPRPPTAILAANNSLAGGVLEALRALRVAVPEQLSLVCFDEDPSLLPFLTVAAQPAEAMGWQAAEWLYERMQGFDGEARQRLLPVEIRVRESVARPREGDALPDAG